MASLLVVTYDPEFNTKIGAAAARADYRVRTVSTLEAGREWLAMQKFDVLLVDGRFGNGTGLSLIEYGWKLHPFLVSGLVNFTGPVEDEWTGRLIGARIFTGPSADEAIYQVLVNRPGWEGGQQRNGVLLVEDLDSPRDIICTYIEAMGYAPVVGARSVDDAMNILKTQNEQFFAVLTDLNMPRESGIDLIRRVRDSTTLDYLPVIVLTAYATAENLIDCVKVGASGFLVKPPRKVSLLAELEKAKRILFTKQSPRLCKPEDAHHLEMALDGLVRY